MKNLPFYLICGLASWLGYQILDWLLPKKITGLTRLLLALVIIVAAALIITLILEAVGIIE